MKRGKRGQSSVEYIFIVAFALMIIIPGAFVFGQYTSSSQDSLRNAQIYKIGNDLVSAAELMYSVGENSWQTIDLTFPTEVTSLDIYDSGGGVYELVVNYTTRYNSEAVFFTEVPISNSSSTETFIQDCSLGCPIRFHEGKNSIRIESLPNSVIVFRVVK